MKMMYLWIQILKPKLINLKIEDIRLEENILILNCKWKKERIVTIIDNTKELLINYLREYEINDSYIFRRTGATHLLNAGVNIVYILKLLGHESIATTQEYVRVPLQATIEAVKKYHHNL